jgi:putative flippase GtrA
MTEPSQRSAIIAGYQRIFSGRIMRFAAVGGIVTVFFMGLNALFGRVVGLGPLPAFFVSYPPALALHFLLNKFWTFSDKTSTSRRQVGEYFFSVVATFLIQWPSFMLLQKGAGLPGWVSAGGANLLQMSASYALLRWKVFHPAAAADHGKGSNPWHRLALLLTVVGGILLVYWTAMSGWDLPRIGQHQDDYFNSLVSGFRKGSLAMDIPVPEALRNAENPWDPEKRPPGIALHDASYYNGHYYLYFGVVPVVVLFWPFRVLVGSDLPLGVATFLYLGGALLLSSWLWLRIVRDRFTSAGVLTKIAGPIILGVCAGQLPLARRISIWEMPIAAGHFYMVCLVASAYLALRGRRPLTALAAAGLSLGLAIGCRPTLGAAGPGLAILVIAVGWGTALRAETTSRLRGIAKALLAAGIPFALIVSGLLAYNWARFGNPLEFGLNYQLTASYEAKGHHFSSAFVPVNLTAYFLSPPQWGRYFPFLHPIGWLRYPKDYYGLEYVYGALVVCPVIWWSLFSPGLLARGKARGDAPLVLVLLAVALGTTAILVCFNTAAARYVPDFLPWWLWLALLGWAWLEGRISAAAGKVIALRLFRMLFGFSVAVSLALTFFQSAALHGILAFRTPAAYLTLSRFFDSPVAFWERLNHEKVGPVTMDVTFPVDHVGAIEPLLVSGVEYEADYFFVYYPAKGLVRLGFASAGDAPAYSPDIPVEEGRTYRLRFEAGSLFPPSGHPIYEGWSERQVHAAKSWVRIEVDGRTVMARQRKSNDGVPEFLQVGRDIRSGAFGRQFTGTLTHLEREDLTAPEVSEVSSGDVVLKVMLPSEVVPGSQPLVVAGAAGSAELVGLRLTDLEHFVLTYEKWGGGFWESGPIAVPADRRATFRIRLGSLLPTSGPYPQGLFNHMLIVWLNGQPVWWRGAFGGLGPSPQVEILTNLVGSSAMRSSYMGDVLSMGMEPVPDWRKGPFTSLELDLTGRGSGIEPLFCTGVPGRADLLAIEWLPNNRARLLLDHWSHGAYVGRDFSWSPELMHHLKLTLPALPALDRPGVDVGTGVLRAEVDGALVWQEEVPFFGAPSSSAVFGKNPVGSSMARQELSCTVGDIRQDAGGTRAPAGRP